MLTHMLRDTAMSEVEVVPFEADAVFDADVMQACAAQAATRPLAGSGAGAFVRDGGWLGLGIEGGYPMGVAGKAPAAYVPGLVDAIRRPDGGGRTVKAGQHSTIQHSTIQHSTIQDNSIQTARLNPAFRAGVGPHPVREPGPA